MKTEMDRGVGLGFMPGAPHEDALAVADAIKEIGIRRRSIMSSRSEPLFGDLVATEAMLVV